MRSTEGLQTQIILGLCEKLQRTVKGMRPLNGGRMPYLLNAYFWVASQSLSFGSWLARNSMQSLIWLVARVSARSDDATLCVVKKAVT